jgi:hypothetical protein
MNDKVAVNRVRLKAKMRWSRPENESVPARDLRVWNESAPMNDRMAVNERRGLLVSVPMKARVAVKLFGRNLSRVPMNDMAPDSVRSVRLV